MRHEHTESGAHREAAPDPQQTPEPDGAGNGPAPFSSASHAAIPFRRPPLSLDDAPPSPAAWAPDEQPGVFRRPARVEAPAPAPALRRRPIRGVLAVAALAAVVAAGGVAWWGNRAPAVNQRSATTFIAEDASPAAAPTTAVARKKSASPSARASRSPSALPAAPVSGSLRVSGRASSLRIRATDLEPGRTVRVIDVEDGTARVSRPDDDETVLTIQPDGTTAGAVEIAVDRSVRWNLRSTGVVDRTTFDMTGASVSAIRLRGGVTANLILPRPDGEMDIRFDGVVERCAVTTPGSVPARVRLAGGAAEVVVDGERRIAAGPTAFTVGDADRRDRIDFAAPAMSSLVWDRD